VSSGFDLASRAGEPVLLLRLLFAALAGAAIGWNRFRAGKPAGVGTHALVALGIIAVCGSWVIVAAATVLVLLILFMAPRLEQRFPARIDAGPR
jgi:uncharacterized membrane protein YhiD involved in acid resistance